jgi:hypothetical protein
LRKVLGFYSSTCKKRLKTRSNTHEAAINERHSFLSTGLFCVYTVALPVSANLFQLRTRRR